jgi:hydrogenase maturation protein HypF
VARVIVDLAARFDAPTVVLSGGVFQNPLLLRMTLQELRANDIDALTHRLVPPNDGGIALGQILVGTSG